MAGSGEVGGLVAHHPRLPRQAGRLLVAVGLPVGVGGGSAGRHRPGESGSRSTVRAYTERWSIPASRARLTEASQDARDSPGVP